MSRELVLVGDVGRTTARLARFEAGARAEVASSSCGWSLADADGVRGVGQVLARCVRRLVGEHDEVRVVSLGVTGAAQDLVAARALGEWLQRELAGVEVILTSDVVTAHAGGLEGGPGVLTVAGTGSVALAVTDRATSHLVDGAGWVLGDAGSGVHIGRAGLAAAMRWRDGRTGGSADLAERARQRFGPLAHLPELIQGDDTAARTIGAFSPDVAAVARQGDEVARRIWREAAAELVESTLAACRAMDDGRAEVAEPIAVTFSGALFDLDDLVTTPVRDAVIAALPHVEPRERAGDALDGAHLLAASGVGLHQGLVLHLPATGERARSSLDRVAAPAPSSTRRKEA